MGNREILRTECLNKYFPGVHAVKDLSINLYENEILGICGENGAGKSTLLKMLSGVYHPDSGEIYFLDQKCNFKTPAESIKAGISIIHQELSYLGFLSVAENIFQGRLPLKKGIVDWNKMNVDADEIFKSFDIDIDVKKTMNELTLAEKQLVEIVKAISLNSKVVIMDEPTSSLGIDDVKKLMEIIHTVVARGCSFIFISHRLEELIELSDRIVVLRDGENVAEYRREEKEYDQFEIISKMVGRTVSKLYPKDDIEKGDVVLEVENVSTDSISNIDLYVKKGEIVGLYGMAGSGQDQILEALFGLEKNYSGTIKIDGKAVEVKNPYDSVKNGIAYVTAERKKDGLILCHSVQQNLMLTSIDRNTKKGIIDQKKEKSDSEKWVKELNIKTPKLSTIINSLSGGNQQKVIMAKWLAIEPKIMLLNEPTRGVDVGAKNEIFKIIQDQCKNGLGVLMISSDMLEMLSMADRIYTVWDGKITAEFSKADVTQEKLMLAAIGRN